jgi:hypothetical protein
LQLSFRSGLILSALIGILSLSLSAIAFRGQPGFAALTFGYFGDTARMLHTRSLADLDPDRLVQSGRAPLRDPFADRSMNASEPFGYNLVLAVPMAAGLNAISAGLLVNLASAFASLILVYLIAALFFSPPVALLAAAVAALNPLLLRDNFILGPESVFVLVTLVAIYVVSSRLAAYDKPSMSKAAVLGLFIVLPVFIRYIGIVAAAAGAVVYIAGTWRHRRERGYLGDVSMFFLVPGLLFGLLLAHNVRVSGVISGHPIGVTPAYTFGEASERVLSMTCVYAKIPLPLVSSGSQMDRVAKFGELAAMSFALLLLWISAVRPKTRMVVWSLLGYELLLAISESITRIDALSPRVYLSHRSAAGPWSLPRGRRSLVEVQGKAPSCWSLRHPPAYLSFSRCAWTAGCVGSEGFVRLFAADDRSSHWHFVSRRGCCGKSLRSTAYFVQKRSAPARPAIFRQ